MSKSNYVIINQEFAEANANYTSNGSRFGYGITNEGQYVTSMNSLDEFPELFEGELPFPGIVIIELDVTDFPQPPLLP